jgi:hypothetical protein
MHRSHPRLQSCLPFLFVLLLGAGQAAAQPPTEGPPGLQDNPHAKQLAQLRAAISVHHLYADALMKNKGVVASGVGLAANGKSAVIKVFYTDTEALRERDIPESLDGVEVQAQVSGVIYAQRGTTCDDASNPTSVATDGVCETYERWPLPVPIGVSIGHPSITAGTLGARVTDGTNVYILSNNHVIAASNASYIGDPTLQPGSFDGGVNPDDTLATLHDFERIHYCDGFWPYLDCRPENDNTMDAAIAWVQPHVPDFVGGSTPIGEFGSVIGYGTPSSTLNPAYGDPATFGDETLDALIGAPVQKVGRTTSHTVGSIDAVDATVAVCYDPNCYNVARFTDQIIIVPGSFSDGGDSGSLIVDMQNRPVGLLFAGSSTYTIANRIDLVLDRFNVTVDGGDPVPYVDLATVRIDVPSPVARGQTTTATVTVRNMGSELVESATITLEDSTEPGAVAGQPITVTDLEPGETIYPTFDWTPTTDVVHSLRAMHQLTEDANPGNDSATLDVTVVVVSPGPQLQLRNVEASTEYWTTVNLNPDIDYGDQMVVVCTPNYDLSAKGPVVARVKNARGTSFEVGLARPWASATDADHFTVQVHCMVVTEGVYDETGYGVKMEAVKLPDTATLVDSMGNWIGTEQFFRNSYGTPVVLGQVESPDTGAPPSNCPQEEGYVCRPDWSVFWNRGPTVDSPPTSGILYVGRQSGEDARARPPEPVMYVVVEAGTGSIDGQDYVADLGADLVRGVDDAPPYIYPLSGLSSASTAIANQAGIDGRLGGGWAFLYGDGAVSAPLLMLAIEEDTVYDAERNHTHEQVGYIVFGDLGEATDPQLQLRNVEASTEYWTTVNLDPDIDYGDQMVVVCTPNYDLSAKGPVVARVKNARGTSFEVGLARPWASATDADHFTVQVHCMVVTEGVYNEAEHGVKMEAVKLPDTATVVDSMGNWGGTEQFFRNSYGTPVVLGQVESPDTGAPPSNCPQEEGYVCRPDWSVFWSRGSTVDRPPGSGILYVGRQSGEDARARPPEPVMYVVIESGGGDIDGRVYKADVGSDLVRGMDDAPPYIYPLSGLSSASTAIANQAGIDGRLGGGWALLYGAGAVSTTSLKLAIEEDTVYDAERKHTHEQVGYVVFGDLAE